MVSGAQLGLAGGRSLKLSVLSLDIELHITQVLVLRKRRVMNILSFYMPGLGERDVKELQPRSFRLSP